MLQFALNHLVEVDGVSRVDRVDETFAVDGEVEQQRSVVSYRAVVEVGKLFGRLHTVVLLRMVEPARTYRHVALGSRPLVAVGVSVLQFGVVGVARINRVLAQECPVGLACEALLVAHPAASRSAVAEDHGVGLNAVEHGEDMRVVIVVLAVDSARVLGTAIVAVATVGTVEPHLEHVAVVGEQVVELSVEVGQVARRSVVGTRAVPRREIHRELQSVLLAGVRQFAHDVALSVLIRRACHVVVVALERPEAEAVMVFCCENDALHACCHERLCPLFAVETCGVERSRVGVAVAPFAVVERVQTEVDEGVGPY